MKQALFLFLALWCLYRPTAYRGIFSGDAQRKAQSRWFDEHRNDPRASEANERALELINTGEGMYEVWAGAPNPLQYVPALVLLLVPCSLLALMYFRASRTVHLAVSISATVLAGFFFANRFYSIKPLIDKMDNGFHGALKQTTWFYFDAALIAVMVFLAFSMLSSAPASNSDPLGIKDELRRTRTAGQGR